MTARSLAEAAGSAVALTFGASALAKLRDPGAFARGVARYRVLPSWMSAPAAVLVIALELLGAVAFASGFFLRLAAVSALVLLAAFAAGVTVNLRRGRELPCMCFGARSEDRISHWSLVRIALLACGVLVVLGHPPVSATSWYGSNGETGSQTFLALTLGVGIVSVARWVLAIPALRSLHGAGVRPR